jgi:DNA-binding NarL/FixJ family response regulator
VIRSVVVGHREAMVAEALAAALGSFPGIAPMAAVTSAFGVEREADRADAVALDETMPGAEEVARRLRRRGTRVVMIAGSGAVDGAPADGEDEGVRVSAGESLGALATALVPALAGRPTGVRALTPRERQILLLVSRGMAGKQVARHLGISPKTVEHHKARICSKLGVPNQTAAVGLALAGGLGRDESWSLSIT